MDETALVPSNGVPPGDLGSLPVGATLTPAQRGVAEAMALKGLSKREASKLFHITDRAVRLWCQHNQAFNAYLAHLTNTVMMEANRQVRLKAALAAPRIMDKAIAYAEGTASPQQYQDRFANMVLDRIAPLPKQSTPDIGIKVPTEHGDVVIVFRSGLNHGPDCPCGSCSHPTP